jgi:serine-type D-Ala-D-Ala carboxypeptidase (penicillin-binding protein 5/6)
LEVERPVTRAPGRFVSFATLTLAAATLLAGAASPAAARPRARRHPQPAAKAEAPPIVPLSQIHVLGNRPAPFALDARAAMLIDATTGETLYSYNEHERMQPASLAKIMTFYLTLDALKQKRIALDTQVPISEAAWRLSMNQSVSRMFLQVGQHVPVEDLLYGLVVSSGNDAAVALAEYLGGSTEAFTEQMNAMGKKLGLTETHFMNPDGLPAEGEYTTAADMIKLARALVMRHPEALKYTGTKDFTFDKITQPNFNSLLFHDSRVHGIKTGHVEEAGYHLVAEANSGDLTLISAVLGTPSERKRQVETEKLLDWAFRSFATARPDWRKTVPSTMPVFYGVADTVAIAPVREPSITINRGQEGKVTLEWAPAARYLSAPVAKGATVGQMTMEMNGKSLEIVPVMTKVGVAPGGIFKRLRDRFRRVP